MKSTFIYVLSRHKISQMLKLNRLNNTNITRSSSTLKGNKLVHNKIICNNNNSNNIINSSNNIKISMGSPNPLPTPLPHKKLTINRLATKINQRLV